MVDDYEHTVHHIDSSVMYLTSRLLYEGRWVKMADMPNIEVHKDHIEVFTLFGNTILRGRIYYSVMMPATQPLAA